MARKVGGRIVKIKLKGFMTYDDLEIIPVKGLNLILGLNGTGKSSIMCAICLGLGGKPQYTGRAVQFSDYIKYNHEEAIVEIELESPRGRNDTIRRVILIDKQSWYLNDKLAKQSEITSLIKKYNIDMSNLCQFLPQEKVPEFSKMDRKHRLVNMIEAIGDPSLVTLFGELKELRNDFVRLGKEQEELKKHKVSEEKSNEKLKPEIQKQEERKQSEHELNIYKLQRTSYQYEVLKNKLNKKSAEIKERIKEISKLEKECDELKAEKAGHSSELHRFQTEVEEKKGEIYECMQNLTKCHESLRAYHVEVDNANIYFENRMKEKTEQIDKLDALRKQIKDWTDILEKNDCMPGLEEKLRQNASEWRKMKKQFPSCQSDMAKLNLKKDTLESKKRDKENEMKSYEENTKFNLLRQNYPDTFTALQWLQQNESSFKSPISYPPLVSMKVLSYENHKFIENAVPFRDLLMFVCEDKGDLEHFVNVMKNEKKLSVNVSMVPDESLADFPSQPITDHMRDLGIRCYLKDLFTAPDPVMRYLCKLFRVHQVPVCNEKAEANINSILMNSGCFFTASERISGKKSNFGQQTMSIKREDLVSKEILPNVKDNFAETELQEIEKSLEECISELDTLERQRAQLERQQEQLRTEKNNLIMEKKKLNDIKTKLAHSNDIYEKEAKDIINEEEERKKLADTIRNLNSKKLEMLAEFPKTVKKIIDLKKGNAVSILCMKFLIEKISTLENKILPIIAALDSRKSDLSKLQRERSQGKAKATELYEIANSSGSEVLASLPLDIDEIEKRISAIEASLVLTNENIAPILPEYQRREHTILNIDEQIDSVVEKIEDLKIKIQEKKEIWLPKLLTHIENVNKKFSEYYKTLKCAGEVSLDQTDDTDDFPNYGLQIKLKYRVDEDFMELSPTHYSGGECSVAAIIFILSLQELTNVPFRCIDEINQGMDTINERTIYQLVANAADNESCCQYFLLSPKLLMDLSYHKDVAVHTIFNSPFLQGKLDVKEHLRIKKSLKR